MKRHFVRVTLRKKIQTVQLSAHIVKDIGIGYILTLRWKVYAELCLTLIFDCS